MKANLCRCNNCGAILIDKNPQIGALEFEIPDNDLEMKLCKDDDGYFWGCPNCNTDDYLTDIISKEMIK